MKKLKRAMTSLLIAASLTVAVPSPQPAQAGIILTPFLVGIVLLVYGIEYHNPLWIVLDADGNLSQDSLEKSLTQTYSFIDDRDVIHNLAAMIREKAIHTPVVDGKKNVTLSKDEVLNILAPTGLADLQPEAVARLVKDLQ